MWGTTTTQSRLHFVKWSHVTKRKKTGGLNIREARITNVALFAKVRGRMALGVNALWAKVCRAKYLRHKGILDYDLRPSDSRLRYRNYC